MLSSINTALSGLTAATNRINVSANNLANQFSTDTMKNGVVSNTPYTPEEVVQSSLATGGVASSVQPVTPPTISVYDPASPGASSNGIAKLPNVDPAQQLVGLNVASYDAQANLAVIKTDNRLFQSVLNIVS